MNTTKFWAVGDKLFTKKIEAEFYQHNKINNCLVCNTGFFALPSHKCRPDILEATINIVDKDKKYIKFLDGKIEKLTHKMNDTQKNADNLFDYVQELKAERLTL